MFKIVHENRRLEGNKGILEAGKESGSGKGDLSLN
jgi:hypothetical protein